MAKPFLISFYISGSVATFLCYEDDCFALYTNTCTAYALVPGSFQPAYKATALPALSDNISTIMTFHLKTEL